MFEAIHGSAPDIAGKNVANPAGLINASIMMLNYLGQHTAATRIHNALLKTLEDGVHTPDIAGPLTTLSVGTREFARELIARFDERPTKLPAVDYGKQHPARQDMHRKNVRAPTFVVPEKPLLPPPKKEFVG